MADHPCNCGDCNLYSTTPHPISPCNIHYCGKERISERQIDCTKHKGCASHPQAREYLMKDVIEELEKAMWVELQSCGVSREVANGIFLNVRSKLIKNGVGGE